MQTQRCLYTRSARQRNPSNFTTVLFAGIRANSISLRFETPAKCYHCGFYFGPLFLLQHGPCCKGGSTEKKSHLKCVCRFQPLQLFFDELVSVLRFAPLLICKQDHGHDPRRTCFLLSTFEGDHNCPLCQVNYEIRDSE